MLPEEQIAANSLISIKQTTHHEHVMKRLFQFGQPEGLVAGEGFEPSIRQPPDYEPDGGVKPIIR